MSILGRLESGAAPGMPATAEAETMPVFCMRQVVNGWVIEVDSQDWGQELYLANSIGEAAEKFRSLADRWERVLAQRSGPKAYGPYVTYGETAKSVHYRGQAVGSVAAAETGGPVPR